MNSNYYDPTQSAYATQAQANTQPVNGYQNQQQPVQNYNNGYNGNYANSYAQNGYQSQQQTQGPKKMDVLNSLPNNTMLAITGSVSYCRITRFIEGQELEEMAKKNNSRFSDNLKPMVKIALSNPTPDTRFGIGDPNAAAMLIQAMGYTSKKGIPSISLESKSAIDPSKRHLPAMYHAFTAPDGRTGLQQIPTVDGREFAVESRVVVFLRVFSTGAGNNSYAIEGVATLDAQPKFFEINTSNFNNTMSQFGINVIGLDTNSGYQQNQGFDNGYNTGSYGAPQQGYNPQQTMPQNQGYAAGYGNNGYEAQQQSMTMSQPMGQNAAPNQGYNPQQNTAPAANANYGYQNQNQQVQPQGQPVQNQGYAGNYGNGNNYGEAQQQPMGQPMGQNPAPNAGYVQYGNVNNGYNPNGQQQ